MLLDAGPRPAINSFALRRPSHYDLRMMWVPDARKRGSYVPVLPWDEMGRPRQPDGKEVLTTAQVIIRMKDELFTLWWSTWREYLPLESDAAMTINAMHYGIERDCIREMRSALATKRSG